MQHDESSDNGTFLYGGFAAPVADWEGAFADAWNERVLNGPPPIPYLHMTEIRDWNWQADYGLTPLAASRRVDEATRVIRSTGSLIPVVFSVEENGPVTKYMADCHNSIPEALRQIHRDDLIPLVGEFRPVAKQRIPAHAADVLDWHAGNASRNRLDREGHRRYWRMVEGGTGKGNRYGYRGEMDEDSMRELAEAFEKHPYGAFDGEVAMDDENN